MRFLSLFALFLALGLAFPGDALAKPSVYPVGTIRYNPEKVWNSFVVLSGFNTVKLIDRNGNLVHEWDVKGGRPAPAKVFAGGHAVSSMYPGYAAGYQDHSTIGLLDFDGNVLRKFNKFLQVDKGEAQNPAEPDGTYWVARAHHDIQLEGLSTGYYAPGQQVKLDGKMMLLVHDSVTNPKINRHTQLHDDTILIVDKDENILWRWNAHEHFDELGLDKYPDALKILNQPKHPLFPLEEGKHRGYDWFHINCASWLGDNQWYRRGDERFHPENIICDSRETGHLFIIDHKTGKIVWQVAPPFIGEDERLGAFIGPHHTHMIPEGLPGAGNILVFDNGGRSPYFPEINNYYSRIVEFNPITKEKVWEYSSLVTYPDTYWVLHGDSIFFSPFISNAQRLPNGNTLINEGSSARLIEVTPELEIVWEYISPYNYVPAYGGNLLYRAYAVPYEWVQQLPKPNEVAVVPPKREQIVIPDVEGNLPQYQPKLDTNKNLDFGPITPVKTENLE